MSSSKGTAFVQAGEDGLPYSIHGAAAAYGFKRIGYQVEFFTRSALDGLALTPETVVIGGVGTVQTALRILGRPVPTPLNLPTPLEPYWGRRVWNTTLQELLEASAFPVFVKPARSAKDFQGRVVRDESALHSLLVPRDGFPLLTLETVVQAQDVVTFVSEWRAFVTRGAVVGLNHYAGDPLAFPAATVARMAIGSYTNAPAGYGADFGVTTEGRTLLVEVNDGFSLGHGGLSPEVYARLLQARWQELAGG